MRLSLADQVVFLSAVIPDATIISLSWIPASGVPVTTYNISYSNTNKKCFDDNKTMSVENQTLNSTLEELEEHTEYLVKVAVWHEGRVVGSNSTMVTTKPVGVYCECFDATTNYSFIFSSICWSLFCECGWCYIIHHHCDVGKCTMYPPEWRHHWLLSPVQSSGE